jgi:hypothetical protein
VTAVDLTPVPSLNDQDEKLSIVDCVQNAVVIRDAYSEYSRHAL